jgi:hypothetical protein
MPSITPSKQTGQKPKLARELRYSYSPLSVARPSPLPPVFQHGGAGDRATRQSHFLSRHECACILAASERAKAIGQPFNRHMTLRLRWLGISPDRIHTALEAYFKLARDWMATKGIRFAYAYTLENGPAVGEHAHILFHLPPSLAAAYFKRWPKWRARIVKRFADSAFLYPNARVIMTRSIGGSDKAYLTNPARHASNLQIVQGYILKAATPETIAELKLAKPHKAGGVIMGRRAGWWR